MSIQIRPDAGEKRKTGKREKETKKKKTELKKHPNSQDDRSQRQTGEKEKKKKRHCAPKSMTRERRDDRKTTPVHPRYPDRGLWTNSDYDCPINVQRLSSCTLLHICASQMGQDRTVKRTPAENRGA